jgi:hypothetical protein
MSNVCNCASPEPALINHGMDSLCEKCGLLIGPLSADAQAAEARYQQILREWGVGRLSPKPQRP